MEAQTIVDVDKKINQEKLFNQTVTVFKKLFTQIFRDDFGGVSDIDIQVNEKNSTYFNLVIRFKNNMQITTFFDPAESLYGLKQMDTLIETIRQQMVAKISH